MHGAMRDRMCVLLICFLLINATADPRLSVFSPPAVLLLVVAMVRLASLLQLAPITLSWGAALPRQVQEYDAIVIGGGPSGLSALSGLARVRRNVLLIDSGEYRNAKTRHLHDLIGFDGNFDFLRTSGI